MAASVPVRAPSARSLPPSCQLSVQAGTHTLHWTDPLAAVKLVHFDPPASLHSTALHCTALQCIPSHSIAPTPPILHHLLPTNPGEAGAKIPSHDLEDFSQIYPAECKQQLHINR